MSFSKKEKKPKEYVFVEEEPYKSPKAKFEVFGEEMMRRKSNRAGTAGACTCLLNGWANMSRL